ncbi:TMF1 factor, partial [Eubucco bourcierii]|nr:TMF1 factor [Eubucco bourcierii]
RMSWFNASQLSSFAKQALSQAQKSIDRVLDIQAEENWPDAVIPDYGDGSNSIISGGWDTSSWGLSSNAEPQNQPMSPRAITKPVRRTVIDESENFFSAFLSPTDVQSIQKNPVVSKPPTKSQRPKEEVKSTLKESQPLSQLEVSVTTEAEVKDSSVAGQVDLKNLNIPKEEFEENSVLKSNAKHGESTDEVTDKKVSALNLEVPEDALNEKPRGGGEGMRGAGMRGAPESTSQPLNAGTKDMGLETKERKPEDRQSNTPSPPISTFSSGTSTTSDIEVLDHESVISESSVSSRQEASDSKSSLHLMQTSFQLLSTSACADYNRLDDFQKLTESCCSSDAFERIDSFSVQSLDSRSVSEINSDDELSGRASASASAAVSPCAPKTEMVDAPKTKSDNLSDVPVVAAEEAEMEESGRSATPVNSEQPDVLVAAVQTGEEQVVKGETEPQQQDAVENLLEEDTEKQELKKMIDSLTEKLEKREIQLLSSSKDKARLEEAYDNLKDEMFRMKEESSSLSSLKEEFAQRIADAEKKLQVACKERDAAKKEVKTVKEELATRLNTNETAELLKEKEEQIKGLMEEGEKLSKQQLHNSNIIKKLRAKEKERENTNTQQNKKIKELEEELKHLKQV